MLHFILMHSGSICTEKPCDFFFYKACQNMLVNILQTCFLTVYFKWQLK